MLLRLYFLLHCICFSYNQFLFSFLHVILCRMCVRHMFNKVLTYLLMWRTGPKKPSVITKDQIQTLHNAVPATSDKLFTYNGKNLHFWY